MNQQARAVVVESPGHVRVRNVQVARPGPGEVLIRTACSVMSPGTERRVVAGQQPGLTYPLVPGYSAAGHVVEVGPGVDLAEGQLVVPGGILATDIACAWGGHSELLLATASSTLPVPAGVSAKQAACTKLLAIAQHGVWLADPRPGDDVAVVGLGLIGQFVARLLAAIDGVRVQAGDVAETRVRVAQAAGTNAVLLGADLAPLSDDAFDIVFDATGHPPVLSEALRLLRPTPWGTRRRPPALVVQGSYAEGFTLPYDPAFRKETRLLITRDEGPADRQAVLNLLASGKLNIDDILSHEINPEAYDAIDSQAHLTAVISWD
ncbi:MAG: zinc-binding dehydrogenase [Phycisphaerae bacterium]